MSRQGERSIRFKPRTVGDAVIGDNTPGDGVCASLSNLIWDPSTPNTLQCRPASVIENDPNNHAYSFPPGINQNYQGWSAGYQVGNVVYGLLPVIAGANTGFDYPVAYNLLTHAFVAVSGIVGANLPASQGFAGDWTPPQMSLMGSLLVVTHTGFDGITNFFGWFDLTAPLAPVWHTGNTAANGLPSVPQACQSFNNRMYFGVKNTAYYTDTLAIKMTGATQSLTIDDLTNITAMGPLPVGTTSQGIVQGILVFKAFKIGLITGDTVTNNLAFNLLSSSVGTSAPRSVVPTPEGVRFMANDGIRDINFFGVLSQPDPDLAVPFIYALYPSRVAAAFSGNIYRISVQNANASGSPFQDYWYDYKRRGWTGPHTTDVGGSNGGLYGGDPGAVGYSLILPVGNHFLLFQMTAGVNITADMWNSYTAQNQGGVGTSFTENGAVLNWTYTPAPMSDLDNLYANSALKSTIELALPAQGDTYNFTAQNEDGSALAQGNIVEPSNQTIWGSFNWGSANWGAAQGGLKPITIPWNKPLVFNRLSIIGTGPSSLGLKLGAYRVGYKRLNYLLN